VADVAEKYGFGAINFRQSFRSFMIFLCRARILNGGSNLSSQETIESLIFRIKFPCWINSGDQ
jgi:hypothetical protein